MKTPKLELLSWIAAIAGTVVAIFSWLAGKDEPSARPGIVQSANGVGANINVGGNSTAPITVTINGRPAAQDIGETPQMISHFQASKLTVLDTKSGLTWMRCAMGQNWTGYSCTSHPADYRWYQAMAVPSTFEYAGHKDWRVPSIHEVKSLVFCSRGESNQYQKDNSGDADCHWGHTKSVYVKLFSESFEQVVWTSSTAYEPRTALTVMFGGQYDNAERVDADFKLRLVRGTLRDRR